MIENNQKFGYTIDAGNKTIILSPCPSEDTEMGLGYKLVFQSRNKNMIVGSVEEE